MSEHWPPMELRRGTHACGSCPPSCCPHDAKDHRNKDGAWPTMRPCSRCQCENLVMSPHWEPYETWCRAERMRLHPEQFEQWTEDEHPRRGGRLSWAIQQVVWDHRNAWEACYAGDMTLEATLAYVANLPPLPTKRSTLQAMDALAQSKRSPRAPKKATPNFNEAEWQAQRAKPVEPTGGQETAA